MRRAFSSQRWSPRRQPSRCRRWRMRRRACEFYADADAHEGDHHVGGSPSSSRRRAARGRARSTSGTRRAPGSTNNITGHSFSVPRRVLARGLVDLHRQRRVRRRHHMQARHHLRADGHGAGAGQRRPQLLVSARRSSSPASRRATTTTRRRFSGASRRPRAGRRVSRTSSARAAEPAHAFGTSTEPYTFILRNTGTVDLPDHRAAVDRRREPGRLRVTATTCVTHASGRHDDVGARQLHDHRPVHPDRRRRAQRGALQVGTGAGRCRPPSPAAACCPA